MPTEFYADTSFLVASYRKDAHHKVATQFIEWNAPLIGLSPLTRIELRNGLRNAEAFGQISRAERAAAFHAVQYDIDSGVLVHVPVNWTEAIRRADELSEQYATQNAQRTIDLLHVAIALESGATTFLSFDQRQRKLAKAAGLKVKP